MNSETDTLVAGLVDESHEPELVEKKKTRTRATKTTMKETVASESENSESTPKKTVVRKTRAKKTEALPEASDAQAAADDPVASAPRKTARKTAVKKTTAAKTTTRKTTTKTKKSEVVESDVVAPVQDIVIPEVSETQPVGEPVHQVVENTPQKVQRRVVAKNVKAVEKEDALDAQTREGHQGNEEPAAAISNDPSGNNDREKNVQRRGRGLRAVVSRTRQKNIKNNQGVQAAAEEGVAAGTSSQQVHQSTRQPSSNRSGNELISFDDIVSGRFDDAGENAVSARPPKRVLQPVPESPKLHKVLAQAGMGSRLEMEQLILEGRISVNGEPAHIGQRIQYGDQVRINGKVIRVQIAPPPARVLAYHKPAGEIVTRNDPQNRPTVFRQLPRLSQSKWLSIGRLDLNTEGLLLFTNSGELANALTHPRFGVEREYAVRVLGGLSDEEKQKLLSGVELEDGSASFKSIENGGGDGANQWYRVVITEGRNREVRRMIESLGHAVSRLIRIRYGAVVLPARLRQGYWQELSEKELMSLSGLVGLKGVSGIAQDDRGRNSKYKSRQMPSGKQTSGHNTNRNRNRQSRYDNKNQPDPMKTSVGYIEHQQFITPVVTMNRNSRNTARKNFAGSGGAGMKRKRFR